MADSKPLQERELKERFKDKEYMNWQRACQALVMLKEFLEPLIGDLAQQLYDGITCKLPQGQLQVCFHGTDTMNIKRNYDGIAWWQAPAPPRALRPHWQPGDDIFSFPPDPEPDVNEEGALDIEAALADESEEEGAAVRRR